jgi:glucan 1,3-beta-glucosidase
VESSSLNSSITFPQGVQTLRIPVGDWMFEPYEPYIGCWDGSLDQLDRVIDLSAKHNMTVLIDVHGMKDSQNGLDNSGSSVDLVWFSNVSFEHWDLRSGDWVGHFNRSSQSYDSINRENLLHGLRVIENIVTRYKSNPTVIGIEPGIDLSPILESPSSSFLVSSLCF